MATSQPITFRFSTSYITKEIDILNGSENGTYFICKAPLVVIGIQDISGKNYRDTGSRIIIIMMQDVIRFQKNTILTTFCSKYNEGNELCNIASGHPINQSINQNQSKLYLNTVESTVWYKNVYKNI